MANPFSKGWKYLKSSLDAKIDENADPKVQIRQAVDSAKANHREISDRAAEIIGRKSQLEMQLNRLLQSQRDYQDQARRALECAAAAEDPHRAAEYNQAAEVIASQLVAVEQELEGVKTQHAAAVEAAEQAKLQQQESAARLQEQLAEVDHLMAQADQAAMQEEATKAAGAMDALGPDEGAPTLDSVREKIEQRYAKALGAQELHQASGGERIQEIAQAGNDLKAASRLEEIRAELNQSKAIDAAPQAGAEDADPRG